MFSFLNNWRAKHLAAGWAAYWLVLATVKLGPAIATGWRLTRGDDTGQNTISFAFSNTTLNLSMSERGNPVYSASASLTEIALWIAVPPVLLLIAWLFRRPPGEIGVAEERARAELGEGLPDAMRDRDVRHRHPDSADIKRTDPDER